MPDPYRVLFPIGILFSLAGALLWPLAALRWIPYPGPSHRALMIEGFEMSFISGFLLTAMPGFTHAERCRPVELAISTAANLGFGAFMLAGQAALAQGSFLAGVGLLALALLRRATQRGFAPPEEFAFVFLGLLQGLVAGVWLVALAAGVASEPQPGLALRVVSLGMVLSLVLGLGALLVPVFRGLKGPLVIPGIAGPHERRGRRALYAALASALVLALGMELAGRPQAGAWLRAVGATPMLLLVWKVARPSGRRALHAVALHAAGLSLLAGLWLAALAATQVLAGFHLVFVGGFGLLTMAIATRVVVAHGGHPLEMEARVLSAAAVVSLVLAAVLRIGAEFDRAHYIPLLGASGVLWAVAWAAWAWRAMPLILLRAHPVVATRPE